jgi:predicted ribosomally synthesized peptide with SipW-like signal peptide
MNMMPIFIAVAVSVMLVGGGTLAYFIDLEHSSGNTFAAGTVDIYLTDNGHVDGQWFIISGQPNSLPNTGELTIHNNGSITGDHLEFSFQLRCYEDDNGDLSDGMVAGPEADTNKTGIGTWPKEILVTYMVYEGNQGEHNIVYTSGFPPVYTFDSNFVTDTDGDGKITLYDLSQQVLRFDDIPLPNEPTSLKITFQIIDTGQPQDYWQGDVCDMKIYVALAQVPSQTVLNIEAEGGIKVYDADDVLRYQQP